MLDGTSREQTMLGGSNWKIIRTDRTLPMTLQNIQRDPTEPLATYEVHATRHGDDLCVSWDLFNAVLEMTDGDAPQHKDMEGVNQEVCEIGKMLTATQLPSDHERYVSLVSRLIVLSARTTLQEEERHDI